MNAYLIRIKLEASSPLLANFPFKSLTPMRSVSGDWDLQTSEMNPEELSDFIDLKRVPADAIEIIALGNR